MTFCKILWFKGICTSHRLRTAHYALFSLNYKQLTNRLLIVFHKSRSCFAYVRFAVFLFFRYNESEPSWIACAVKPTSPLPPPPPPTPQTPKILDNSTWSPNPGKIKILFWVLSSLIHFREWFFNRNISQKCKNR